MVQTKKAKKSCKFRGVFLDIGPTQTKNNTVTDETIFTDY